MLELSVHYECSKVYYREKKEKGAWVFSSIIIRENGDNLTLSRLHGAIHERSFALISNFQQFSCHPSLKLSSDLRVRPLV